MGYIGLILLSILNTFRAKSDSYNSQHVRVWQSRIDSAETW